MSSLDRVGASGGDEDGGFAVGVGEVRGHDGAALGVGTVGPVAQRRIHRSAELRLVRPVAAPRHDGLLESPHHHVAEGVLAVLLADIGKEVSAVDGTVHAGRASGELLRAREQPAELGLEHVHHPDVLAELLELGAAGGEEVDVGVAGPPAAGGHVGGAVEAEGEFALAGFDPHGFAQRCVFEAAGHVDDHVSAGEPALAGAVDVGVGLLAEADVAADVVVPAAEVLVDVVVVAVWLVGDAFGGAEVHPAGDLLAGGVVEHGDVYPVAAGVDEFEAYLVGCGVAVVFEVGPGDLAEFGVALAYGHGGRGQCGDVGVGGAGRCGRVACARSRAGRPRSGAAVGRWRRRGRPRRRARRRVRPGPDR